MTEIRSVAVFCGAMSGHDPRYARLARETGAEIARRRLRLVTGGGSIGLMGHVADGAIEAGGESHGVIPAGLFAGEIAHTGMTHLETVSDMAARKARMFALSEGVICLPGGFGTLDEAFEALTGVQIGTLGHPVVFLDEAGYWDGLLRWVSTAYEQGFLHARTAGLIRRATTPSQALDSLRDALRVG